MNRRICIFMLVILLCCFITLHAYAELDITADSEVTQASTLSYDFIKHNTFENFWYNGIYRCGSDFAPGDYYIFSLFGAGALYDVEDNPNDFSWSYQRVLRKLHVEQGQYVKVQHNAILVSAKEVDETLWHNYGVFLVGKDLLPGKYLIETISDTYYSDLINIQGIKGAYQICDESPETMPISCSPLFANSTYVNLEEGQYVVINNASLHYIVDGYVCEDFVDAV